MSILSDLFSLEGLVTISVGSLISIRTLRLTWVRNEGNLTINGNNNIVIYNQQTAKQQGSYTLLWRMFAIVLAVLYPLFGLSLNVVLQVAALLAIPVSVLGVVTSVRRFGWEGGFSLFYVAGSIIVWWLASRAEPYLPFAAQEAAKFFGNVQSVLPYLTTPLTHGENVLVRGEIVLPRVQQLSFGLLAITGFAALFLSTCYLAFAFIRGRHFDDVARFTGSHLLIAAASFLFVCNVLLALHLENFSYVRGLIMTVFPFFI